MKVCYSDVDLKDYLEAVGVSADHPVTVSKFIKDAKEIEVDCVAERGVLKAFVVSEHVENAGVHSGDASILLPPQKLYMETLRKLKKIAESLASALKITGPFNIQCLARDNKVSVIETNLRSSRTFPFISKVTGVDFIKMATDAMFHKNIPVTHINFLDYDFVAAKVAQFSFARLTGADPVLDVEMASTGEVACFGADAEEAFLLAELSVGGKMPKKGIFLSLGGEINKLKFLESSKLLATLGVPIYATENTSKFLRKHGVNAIKLNKIHEKKSPNVLDYFQDKMVDMAVNLPISEERKDLADGYDIRRAAVDKNIPLFTNIQKADLFTRAITLRKIDDVEVKSWDEYKAS